MAKTKKVDWTGAEQLHVMKTTEGGPGYGMIRTLKEHGIPARKAPSWCGTTSPHVGHVGIEVPKKFIRRACKIAFG